jgi:hypothetical protein
MKVGDKFRCNKDLVDDATDTIFTIDYIGLVNVKISWVHYDGLKKYANYDIDMVNKYFYESTWLNLRDERKKKLLKLNKIYEMVKIG